MSTCSIPIQCQLCLLYAQSDAHDSSGCISQQHNQLNAPSSYTALPLLLISSSLHHNSCSLFVCPFLVSLHLSFSHTRTVAAKTRCMSVYFGLSVSWHIYERCLSGWVKGGGFTAAIVFRHVARQLKRWHHLCFHSLCEQERVSERRPATKRGGGGG